jgi:hypothetical protein
MRSFFFRCNSSYFLLLLAMASCLVSAQTLTVQSVNKQSREVTFVVSHGGDLVNNRCGFRLDFGNGEGKDMKVAKDEIFPMRLNYTYPTDGSYAVSAVGKRVTNHWPCNVQLTATAQIATAQIPAPIAAQPSPVPTSIQSLSSKCAERFLVKNAAGEEVPFNVKQMVIDSGSVAKAREKVTGRLVDAQSKALDDTISQEERATAKAFAQTLIQLRSQVNLCE